MRVVPKLTFALVAGTCAILAVNGFFRVRREVAFFEANRSREHELIGTALAAATATVLRSEGEQRAIETVRAADLRLPRLHIRWLSDTSTTQPVTRVVSGGDTAEWDTYIPIEVDGVRRGTIELSEGAEVERSFARSVVMDSVAMALALALLSAVFSFFMGQWLVGRPVELLRERARQIGRGEFGGTVVMARRDELADLAGEMNTMADKLATTLEQLRHADRLASIGKLASGVAHELGTPLNVVSARASMITRTTSLTDCQTYARIIGDATEKMTKIIQQLLQFARRTGPKRAVCDVGRLVCDAVEMMGPLAKKQSVTLRATTAGKVDAVVDGAQVVQVVMNLVVNAIQATQSSGEVTVEVCGEDVRPPGDDIEAIPCVAIRVVDRGSGINESDLQHLFEPFFTTKDIGDGTGLGLAVAYGIVRDHDGWITVASEVGRGSTFAVHLPRAPS